MTTVKVITLGDSGTGKSCLLTRFAKNEVQSASTTTLGVDFQSRLSKWMVALLKFRCGILQARNDSAS